MGVATNKIIMHTMIFLSFTFHIVSPMLVCNGVIIQYKKKDAELYLYLMND